MGPSAVAPRAPSPRPRCPGAGAAPQPAAGESESPASDSDDSDSCSWVKQPFGVSAGGGEAAASRCLRARRVRASAGAQRDGGPAPDRRPGHRHPRRLRRRCAHTHGQQKCARARTHITTTRKKTFARRRSFRRRHAPPPPFNRPLRLQGLAFACGASHRLRRPADVAAACRRCGGLQTLRRPADVAAACRRCGGLQTLRRLADAAAACRRRAPCPGRPGKVAAA